MDLEGQATLNLTGEGIASESRHGKDSRLLGGRTLAGQALSREQTLPKELAGTWKHPQYPGPWQALRLTRNGQVALRQETPDGPRFTSANPSELTERWTGP